MQLKAGTKVGVGVQVDLKGVTLDQYDEMVKRMGFEPQGAGAPGCMFHWVTKTPDGISRHDLGGHLRGMKCCLWPLGVVADVSLQPRARD